jgi:GNAT superfamily N-acetyltransferase
LCYRLTHEGGALAKRKWHKTNQLPPVATSCVNSWDHEAHQYDASGEPGIEYNELRASISFPTGSSGVVVSETLLYRGPGGDLRGILNYFPDGCPGLEEPGSLLVIVHPSHRGSGIGKRLLAEADRVADDFIAVLAGLERPSQAEPSAAPFKSDLEVQEGRKGPTRLCLTQ